MNLQQDIDTIWIKDEQMQMECMEDLTVIRKVFDDQMVQQDIAFWRSLGLFYVPSDQYMKDKLGSHITQFQYGLYRAGYSLFDSIENALEYGVPQFRDRLILVGFNRRRFGKNLRYTIGTNKTYEMDRIKMCNWPTVEPFQIGIVRNEPQDIIPELTVEYWFRQNNVENHANSRYYFNTVANNKFVSIAEGDTSKKSFKRLHRWRYSPTAAYGNNEVHLHPYQPRRISIAEALSIQSLPVWFEVLPTLSLSAKFKMVGNGVPYLLANGIAMELQGWIEEHMD